MHALPKNDLIFRIAGSGGEGVISVGDLITQACARVGLDVYTFKTFPAEIKGGYAMYQVRAGINRIYNQGDTFDVFCVFSGEAFDLNHSRVKPGTALVYDSTADFEPDIPEGVHAYPIPLTQAAKALGNPRAKNTIALGSLSRLFNVPEASLREVIATKFRKKGHEVIEANLEAFERGWELANALPKTDPWKLGTPTEKRDVVVLSGNYAVGLGSLLGDDE